MFGNSIFEALSLTWVLLFYPSYQVSSSSMLPNYHPREIVIGSRYPYGFCRYSFAWLTLPIEGRIFGGLPERGDVISFRLSDAQPVIYLKRVVGLPGDRIQMVNGVLAINGQPVELSTVGDYPEKLDGQDALVERETLPNGVSYEVLDLMSDSIGDQTQEFTVPEGEYFVLGDNRDNSNDSRFDVGMVPYNHVISRLWP